MKNWEFYEKEIEKILDDGKTVAMNKNYKITSCAKTHCFDCAFKIESVSCTNELLKFLYEEHVERPKLTRNEKNFLEILDDEYKYIARDAITGSPFVYKTKPEKSDNLGIWCSDFTGEKFRISINYKVSFDFIKWEDTEPWSIKDLKELEIEE